MAASRIGDPLPEVTARDARTLELRRVLPMPTLGRSSHDLDAYFYFPRSFGISSETWDQRAFYRDAKVYLRVTAPGLGLVELADLDNPINPIGQLRGRLPQLMDKEPPAVSALVTLAQVHGAALADALSEEAKRLRGFVKASPKTRRKRKREDRLAAQNTRRRRIEVGIERLCADGLRALAAVRRVRAKATAYRALAPPALFDALAFAEEYATAVLDEELAELARAIDADPRLRDGSALATRLRLQIARTAEIANRRRLDQGFAVPWGRAPDQFTYRTGLLKKELQRALYIDTRRTGADPLVTNTAAMVAAGLAATWATLAQLPLWTGGWSTRQGMLFLSVAVGAYMIKDRIKEWTRTMLSRRLLAWDYNHRITTASLERAGLRSWSGRARERMRHLAADTVPASVHALRVSKRTVRGVTFELENVVHYQRALQLHARSGDSARHLFGVKEIMRLSLTEVLRRLDDPKDRVAFYDDDTCRFVRRKLPRLYHLNLVVRVTDESQATAIARFRVIVNRDGIRTIEQVSRAVTEAPT